MGEGGVDLEHDDEELQEVDVHLHRFLTDELLPAVVNQIRKAAGQLTREGTQTNCCRGKVL